MPISPLDSRPIMTGGAMKGEEGGVLRKGKGGSDGGKMS